jgi:hypothetical protein
MASFILDFLLDVLKLIMRIFIKNEISSTLGIENVLEKLQEFVREIKIVKFN